MAASDKQLAANRRNAQRSTGPRTAEGKARSSQNAIKHGLLSQHAVIKHGAIQESQEDFDALLAGLSSRLGPTGRFQLLLVEQLAVSFWRLRRVIGSDTLAWALALGSEAHPSQTTEYSLDELTAHPRSMLTPEELTPILRYWKHFLSQIDRTLRQLHELQNQPSASTAAESLGHRDRRPRRDH